jgi:cytochrome c biogenesis protein
MSMGKSKAGGPLRRAWRGICSIKLTAVLLSAVLIVSLLGTLFPQLSAQMQADPVARAQWEQAVRARYGALSDIYRLTGLFNVYASPILVLILAALFVNGLACTINRLRLIWRTFTAQPKVVRSDSFYGRASTRASFEIASKQTATDTVRELLAKRRYRLLIDEREGATHLRGDKNRFARVGTLVTHSALVLIAVAAVWSARASWKEPAVILGPGESYEVPHGHDFQVRHEGFEVDRYADGAPRDYRSHLVLVQEGSEIGRKTVRVNDPLVHEGVGFYLWAAGPALRIVGLDDHGMPLPMEPSWHDEIRQGEVSLNIVVEADEVALYLPTLDVNVRVSPNYEGILDESEEAPLVFVEASLPGQPEPLFSDYVPRGEAVQLPGFSLQFVPDYYTMLQVVSDPGFAPVVLASLLGVMGLLISFYFCPSRVWVKLTDRGLVVAGSAVRNRTAFQTEFSKLVKTLGEKLP